MRFPSVIAFSAVLATALAGPSAVELLKDVYDSCLSSLSVGCVKPKALSWAGEVADKNVIRITDDLLLIRKYDPLAQV